MQHLVMGQFATGLTPGMFWKNGTAQVTSEATNTRCRDTSRLHPQSYTNWM